MNRWHAMTPGDKVAIASAVIPLVVWWLIIGRHRYGVPKGAK